MRQKLIARARRHENGDLQNKEQKPNSNATPLRYLDVTLQKHVVTDRKTDGTWQQRLEPTRRDCRRMENRTCACGLRSNLSHVHSESLVKVALYELESSFLKLSRFETPKVSNIWSYFRFLRSAREFVITVTRLVQEVR